MKRALLLVFVTGCALGRGDDGASVPPPPKVVKESRVDKLHGVDVPDPYRNLENGADPAVAAWTDAQNRVTRRTLDSRPNRSALRGRLEVLASIGRLRQPRVYGRRVFFQQRTGTENQPALCVRDGFTSASRRIVDPNTMSNEGLVALDWWYPSHDGSKIAFGTSEGGNEISTLRVKEVETGKVLSDEIPRTRAAAVAWLPDQSGFYYTQYPAPGSVPEGDEKYHRRVYFHKLGTSLEEDRLVFGDTGAKEDWPNVSLSRDGRWLVVDVHMGWSKSEVYVKDLNEGSRWKPVIKGHDAKFFPLVHDDTLFFMTNWKAPKFRIMSCSPADTDPGQWKEVVPEGEATISSFEIVGNRITVLELRDATSRLRSIALDGSDAKDIELPGLGTVAEIHGDPEGTNLVFDYLSFFSPPALYRYDVNTGALKEFERLEGIDTSKFESSQVRYTSKDGTAIPMFLVHQKGMKRDGNQPTLLMGYGGFSVPMTPFFSSAVLMWLEKGGVFAVPNLRGGGEYGEAWHQAGMLKNKQNTFDDFIAAAEYLIKNENITSPKRLAIMGGSNGGLLVGAAMTQRPDLFKAVVCDVPLLDMVRFHKFQLARLWIPEYGDPDKAEDFQWLYAYSPYHRVKDGTAYPAVLLRTAEGDTRVDPMHARKMCARLLEASTSRRPILFWCEKKAGHGAGKPLSKQLDDLADSYSFLTWQLEMN